MFRAMKDAAVSAAINSKAAPLLEPFCQSFKVKVDSQAKVITLEALPRGENTPVFVELHGYRLYQQDGNAWLGFDRFLVSREWLAALAEKFIPGNAIRLPDSVPYDLIKQYI